jgi:uncharacterized protein YjbI with pentapeptide repeats
MANPEHLEILKRGVLHWNQWREKRRVVTPDLGGAALERADLSGADFRSADLHGADLTKAELSADLSGADLSGADLRDAMLRRANLRSARLRGAHGSGADLRRANLGGADLGAAQLDAANFSEADLGRAHLAEAYLRGANFRAANLSRANLSQTNLLNANLQSAGLEETNFELAHAGSTSFANVDLSRALGLKTIKHDGPSTIGIDTIYKSGGTIPGEFLRGCGVPDEFIAYVSSMVGRAIEFYSCFISYSTQDQEFAQRLYADLQANGVRCWFAPEEMKAGRKIHEQIDEAIRLHDKLLLILSKRSMNSNWVKTEIINARAREEQEHKQLLFPIALAPFEDVKNWKLFDADRGIDLAREIREYFIPDFNNWKDYDSYQTAFERLVKDFKIEATK